MNRLARSLDATGAAALAEGLLLEALNVRCRAFGADCPVREETLLALGELLAREDRGAEAVRYLEEGLAIVRVHGHERDAERARAALECCRSAAPDEERP
jgi:hypothetical protein